MHVKARGAAALLTVPALLLAAGCSGTPEDGDHRGEGKSSGRPSATGSPTAGTPGTPTGGSPSGAPTTAAGSLLARAALAQGDLDGYQISAQGKDPSAPDGQPQADRAACQPLADIMGDKPDPAARETVNRGIGSRTKLGLAVSASLSSYTEAGAENLVSGLRRALASCASGFSATVEKQTGTYRDVKAVPYRTAGDDTVSWNVTASAAGVSAPVHLLVVREGSTVIRMMALNVASQDRAEVPRELPEKQLEKLAAAQREG
ncbi:hypothetical protein [Streptomyces sp. NPDC097619]|uniref:hypothetical protein n=1 Tax=Streptomyces sp. NPDC097619 TaxID=3157228 RepID=UPI00332BB44A